MSSSEAFILGREEEAKKAQKPSQNQHSSHTPEGPFLLQQEQGRGCGQENESTAHRELPWLAPRGCLPMKQAQNAGTEHVRGLGSPSST